MADQNDLNIFHVFILACFKDVPVSQVGQVAGIQAIIENVARAKRVHIIDLFIKCRMRWKLLMQALASRNEYPLESLRITAVGVCSRQMESAGKWITSFAQTMNLPFSSMMVTMSDMFDLKEDQFEIDAEETVIVYSAFFMRTMIPQPAFLDTLMKVIRKFNPCVVMIFEVDSNLNSSDYVSRFIEALFFYSAYFDCLDVCMEKNDQSRSRRSHGTDGSRRSAPQPSPLRRSGLSRQPLLACYLPVTTSRRVAVTASVRLFVSSAPAFDWIFVIARPGFIRI